MKRISAVSLLLVLLTTPFSASAQDTTSKSDRQSAQAIQKQQKAQYEYEQKQAKAQMKAQRKADKAQQRAAQKYEKQQRELLKNANRPVKQSK